jgi:hypothetical protein
MFTDASDEVVYTEEMEISGTTATLVVQGRRLPTGTYSAGRVEIFAISSDGLHSARDQTLELTVTASGTSYQMQVATALRAKLRADSRFADINDDDILVITKEENMDTLPQYPAIGIIPDSDDASEAHSVTQRRHKVTVWVLIAVQEMLSKLTQDDITEPDTVHNWMRAAEDLCEEEDTDPEERLGKLTQTLHTTRCNPKVVKEKSLYIAFLQVEATILAK